MKSTPPPVLRLGDYAAIQTLRISTSDVSTEVRALARAACHSSERRLRLSRVESFYHAHGSLLLLVNAGHHPESIEPFTKSVALLGRDSIVFSGVEAGNALPAPAIGVSEGKLVLVVIGADTLDELGRLVALASVSGATHSLVSPTMLEGRLLCPTHLLDALFRRLGMDTPPPPAMALLPHEGQWLEEQLADTHTGRRQAPYDPVWAQINEASISAAATLLERITDLEALAKSPSFRGIDLRLPIGTYRQTLAMLASEARRHRAGARRRSVSIAGQIDAISGYVDQAQKQVALLTAVIEQRRGLPRSGNQEGLQFGTACSALDGVAHYCGRALEHTLGTKASDRRQWISVLGERVGLVEAAEFRGVSPLDMSWTSPGSTFVVSWGPGEPTGAQPGAQIGVVEFPRHWALRSGSYPLVAWALSREYRLADEAHSAVRSELMEEVEREVHRLRRKSVAAELADSAGVAEIAEALLRDIISVSLVGPCYVYALARFGLLGRLGGLDWNGLGRHVGVASDGLVRLRLNLRILKALGIRIPFFTNAFPAVGPAVSGRKLGPYLEGQGHVLRERYEFASGKVMESLRAGRVEGWAPDLVFNALWRAVAERGAYLNEASVFWSLAKWGHARPEPDLAESDC